MRVLVVNAGSSSLKLRIVVGSEVTAQEDLPADKDGFDTDRLGAFVGAHDIEAVGHRVVHGGREFTEPVRLDEDVVRRLRDLTDLAPLHQPKSLAGIDAVEAVLPEVPAVACFDTAFHAGLPMAAATYALPQEWRDRWQIRRYGFHGLSHAYASRRAAELVGRPAEQLRTVVCHLGAGASLCAVAGGHSVDTTMGFTPLEGLVMATRSGSVDPGLLLWLLEHAGLTPGEVTETLEHRSGLLGLGGEADMRVLLQRAAHSDARARLAVDTYLHSLVGAIAAMTAALGGLDLLVFTGGVGENSQQVRSRAAESLRFLGVTVDEQRNADVEPDADISAENAACRTLVIAAREDLEIARGVTEALDDGTAGQRSRSSQGQRTGTDGAPAPPAGPGFR